MKQDPLAPQSPSGYSLSCSGHQQITPSVMDELDTPPPYTASASPRTAATATAATHATSNGTSSPRISVHELGEQRPRPSPYNLPSEDTGPYVSLPEMTTSPNSREDDHAGMKYEDQAGCCFSDTGGCCFSTRGGCCFSDTGGCCFSESGGCCFSSRGGCCCSHGGGGCCSSGISSEK
ncbi:hypothetical protein M406DRAFT_322001 [Cryphonectria parasitica EP155]|uniref:Uncharacterized protein n=1 Tax=Cryphonectria parasitica (strain ATCC 38755 / EP155) TaxID=660469 RepID=A0A9P4Y243_CRYP1|nr:uncharacterized protein M406DRAFT_322001 [Cryphonectria parasitica EP155]KAF3765577.1 hypothetical protein M406DRAFT_322001 [Cryphonectria parasitica EP155]